MTARDDLRAHLVCGTEEGMRRADELLDAYRAEVRAEAAADVHRAELPTFAAGETPENVAKVVRAVDVRLAQHGAEAPYGVAATDFFQRGHTYTREHRGVGVEFRVCSIDTSPDGKQRAARGWLRDDYSSHWQRFDADDMDGWTEVTSEVTS